MSDISSEDVVDVAEPRHDIGSPENKLLQMIHAAGALSKFGNTADEIATSLGVESDLEVVALIDTLITPGASLASPTSFGGEDIEVEDDDWLRGAATKDKRPQYNWHHSRYKGE